MPELPTVRMTERGTFTKCPQRWWWKYRDGYQKKGESPSALWFGTGIHKALESWYGKGRRRGKHPADSFREWCGDEIRHINASYSDHDRGIDERPKYEDARELGTAMLTAYVDHWGRDSDWFIIATEREFHTLIKRAGMPVAYYDSTFDLVYRDLGDGQIYIADHKTAAQISTAYLSLDGQAGGYFAVASAVLQADGTLKKGERIAGVTYNFLRKALPDDRPEDEDGRKLNKDGSVSKRQPPANFVRETVERLPSENRTQLERLTNEIAWMNAIRDGSMPLIKNTTKDCTFCEFFVMCQLHERGGDGWKEYAKAEFVRADPYAPH